MTSQPRAKDSSGFPVTKVYFRSDYRAKGGHSDLTWEIPGKETVTTGPATYVAFTDFQCGHSWYVVQTGVNDILHIITLGNNMVQGQYPIYFHSLQIAQGNYTGTTLAAAIGVACNTISSDGTGATYNCSFVTSTSKIHLTQTGGNAFKVPSLTWLALNDFGGQRLQNPPAIAPLINVPDPFDSDPSGYTINWKSGPVHILRLDSIYIRCPELGHSTIDPSSGRRDIVRRVPVTSEYSEVLVSSDDQSPDWLPCVNRVIRQLTLRLTDANSKSLTLESPWSCSIVFQSFPEL